MSNLNSRISSIFITIPNFISALLMSLNIFPHLVYGRKYIKYKKQRLLANYKQFDNSSEVLKIINNAVKTVPYYKLYNQASSIEEFQTQWSFIDKEIVMQDINQFISTEISPKDFVKGTTGGTSGKPLQLIIPKNRHVFELATMHTMWQTTGWNYHTRAVIRNHKLPVGKNYFINPVSKEYIFDGFRTDDDYYSIIYNTIRKKKIKYVHAYPSSAYQFCTYIKKKNLDPSVIKAFLSGSENVFDFQIDLIENQLGIRFYNWYGHSEKLVLGGYCNGTRNYHMEPTYGYFELIDEKGNIISTPGQIGEIVGTTLHNNGMPLIRYRTEDFAEYVGNYCPHCGRHLPIIKNIKGRWSGEKIYNQDGTYVTTTALNLHNEIYEVINGLQYIQNEKGKLEILIIKSNKYKEKHEIEIFEHIKSKLKPDAEISIKYVDKLIKQPNGKFLLLISNINNNEAVDAIT